MIVVDYRKRRAEHFPIFIDGAVIELVESFKFLGVHITRDPSWPKHTNTVVKMARQRLKRLKRFSKSYTAAPLRAS